MAAGVKALEELYGGHKHKWKLASRKAPVFLKKAGAKYEEVAKTLPFKEGALITSSLTYSIQSFILSHLSILTNSN